MKPILIFLVVFLFFGCFKKSSADNAPAALQKFFTNADFTFAVYGETAGAEKIHKKVISRISVQKPDLIIHTGNLVKNPSAESDWEEFFDTLTPVSGIISRFYVVPGKIEAKHPDEMKARFANVSGLMKDRAYYSFVYKNSLFIILNPYLSQDELYRQQHFMIEIMKQFILRNTGPIFVFCNKPIYSTGPSGVDPFLTRNWLIILEHFRATIIFSGSDKIYGRYKTASSTDTVCLVSGLSNGEGDNCAQAPNEFEQYQCKKGSSVLFIGVKNNFVGVKVLDADGRIIDSFELNVSNRFHTRAGIEGVYERF